MRQCVKQGGLLTAVAVGLWVLLAGPAYWLAGTAGIVGVTCSALLCLIPGWVVFFVVEIGGQSITQSSAILLATGARMAFVLVGALTLREFRPGLGLREFFPG